SSLRIVSRSPTRTNCCDWCLRHSRGPAKDRGCVPQRNQPQQCADDVQAPDCLTITNQDELLRLVSETQSRSGKGARLCSAAEPAAAGADDVQPPDCLTIT